MHLVQRGIKSNPSDLRKIDDFGRSMITGEQGFFDFGTLEKGDELEIDFFMDIYRPVVEAREHLRGRGYPQELARWWEESIEASD